MTPWKSGRKVPSLRRCGWLAPRNCPEMRPSQRPSAKKKNSSNVLFRAGNWAKFIIREDRTAEGLTSIRGGRGVFRFTVDCLRAMLTHAGFEILDERRPPEDARRRFPWYSALAQPRGTPGG